jgi:pimeloyl-ACP methyl ester carboxylesterase
MAQHSVQLEVGRGVSLAGTEWPGDDPPMVLLHAGVCDRRSWYGVGDLLGRTRRVLAYDRRGYGESSPSRTAYRDVDDLFAVCESLSDAPVWLVGSSMGGEVALDAALLRPEAVAGLVLLAPAVSGAPELPEERLDAATKRLAAAIDAAFENGDHDELVRLETWLWLDGPHAAEGRVGGASRALARDMNAIVVANEGSEHSGRSGLDTWQRVEEIERPVTVAWGDLDIALLVDRCRELAQRLPDASVHVLPATAHLPYLEDAAAVADLITAAAN